MKRTTVLCLAFAGLAGACSDSPTMVREVIAVAMSAQSCPAGTTISAYKTACGFSEREITYDWDITKTANPTSIEVAQGQSAGVEYRLCATRSVASDTSTTGVRGEICVTNEGAVVTEGLRIVDQVRCESCPGVFEDVPGAGRTIVPATQLQPGETKCFDYDIGFASDAGASCRNTAVVTITNHTGYVGYAFGPETTADFDIPDTAKTSEIDEAASASDVEAGPLGLSGCEERSFSFSGSGTDCRDYTTNLTNVSAACGQVLELTNTAMLTENDSGEERTDSATVDVFTGACSAGCTRTIGFWKTHAGFTGNNPDLVTQHLDILLGTGGGETVTVSSAEQAVDLLGNGGNASNGINKLYGQLLGAKLNIASGASSSAVAATIAAADTFLATHDAGGWTSLPNAEKQMVLGWQSALDTYNNGIIGPGHCD